MTTQLGSRLPLPTADPAALRPPLDATRFVGRAEARAELAALLGTERLVTLTGVGGGGKTRLAARVATDLAGCWSDGTFWVELAAVTDAAQVPALVAATIGAPVEPALGPARSLAVALDGRQVLVCLDNCEHVLDGAAAVVAALVACPGITVLATSREPLAVSGEVVWPVPPLTVDESAALFADRARGVRPGPATDTAAVRALCLRLDGIPLAVGLAAAWLRTLTPTQIEARLDDRFALLVRGSRGAAARQRTLAASIGWSYDLLAEPERVMFRRLAVCTGGFTLDAARAVAGTPDVLGPVSRLVDTSLVVAEVAGQRVRYRMLETIREYAAARLAECGEAAATAWPTGRSWPRWPAPAHGADRRRRGLVALPTATRVPIYRDSRCASPRLAVLFTPTHGARRAPRRPDAVRVAVERTASRGQTHRESGRTAPESGWAEG